MDLPRRTLAAAAAVVALAAVAGLADISRSYPIDCAVVVGLAFAIAIAAVAAVRPLRRMSERRFLIMLVLIGGGLRLVWIAAVPNQQVTDYAIYHELAAAVARGQGYVTTGPVGREDLIYYIGADEPLPYTTAYRAPGTPLWGAALYRLFGVDPLWFKLSNVLLGAGAVLLLYALLKQSGPLDVARAAALGWAVYPDSVFATNLVCSEILFTFVLLLLALSLARDEGKKASSARLLLDGLLSAGGALIRPMWLPVIGAAGAVWWLKAGGREASRRLGPLVLGLALGLAPWAWRNWRAMHAFIPISTGERITLVEKSFYDVPDAAKSDPAWKTKWDGYKALHSEQDRYEGSYAMTLENLRQEVLGGPVHAAGRLATNALAAFGDEVEMLRWSVTNSYRFARQPGPLTALSTAWIDRWGILGRASYLAVAIGALAGALQAGGFGFLAGYFVLNVGLLLIFKGEPRYHFPLMPFLIGLAALAASRAELSFQERGARVKTARPRLARRSNLRTSP
jgi:hypothetical protein